MKILIIKLTSMGDLMHALPALTDASKQIPNIEFDWVVDESFSEIPLWHPKVNSVIKTNHRIWKRNIFSFKLLNEINNIKKILNNKNYDAVIDMQNNLKSAAVSYLIKEPVNGMDKESVREYLAHFAYQFKHTIVKDDHAINRQRNLLAMSLDYKIKEEKLDYGITTNTFKKPKLQLPKNYLFLVHNASWPSKMWPISYWQELIKYINQEGFIGLLPSGSIEEYERAREIASVSDQCIALKTLSLNETAFIINQAEGCVCSDTGLAHLAALLNKPSVTMYSVTKTGLIGTKGKNQKHIISSDSKMESIHPQLVWKELELLMKTGGG
ncbi:MAG: lipopolysaccharide heptosyltransferase I [Pseudomonadota bacterium]|nr:lipopolysaccharide heptosyltransferase I [Pseudomonadota bacterium]